MRKDPRSKLARWVDIYLGGVLLWILSFLVLRARTGDGFWALLLSSGLVVAAYWIVRHREKKRKELRERNYRLWIAGKKCIENMRLLERGLFCHLVGDILRNLDGFEKIQPAQGTGLDLTGYYRGVPVAVWCANLRDEEEMVSSTELRNFVGAMAVEGYRNGILVTTGGFSPEVYKTVKKIRNRYRITLVDQNKLVEWAATARSEVYPTGEALERVLETEIETEAKSSWLDLFLADPRKASSYLKVGLILFLFWLLSGQGLAFKSFYLIGAFANFFLSAAVWVINWPLEGEGNKK
ncbi:restriction endonuclease [Calderihabitans maritimus]|uniref:Restriction endonuclease type IV Mrr domain-containing protein n=1 Tax=Calderihabitans maritimus TaxID=1246530 RepID=A0A1Z5HNM6_9FIRM|nr:restriction endonuclease [Calderihabitans maritimus]GAW90931.1 hypothetical protein PTH_2666 [Calderihabitans maritimus]